MLTRRNGIKLTAAALASPLPAHAAPAAPTVKTPVNFTPPPGATDCHVHVIGDPAKYPFWSGRGYTPPVADARSLLALQHALHLDRVVIVTPSVYGTDNRATLDGMKFLGRARARGVAVIGPETTPAEIAAMNKAGIRGVRVNLLSNGVTDPAKAADNLDAAVKQLRGTGWHIQVYAGLPLIVVITSLGIAQHKMRPENAAALVGAGIISVLLLPMLGLNQLRGSPGLEAVDDELPEESFQEDKRL